MGGVPNEAILDASGLLRGSVNRKVDGGGVGRGGGGGVRDVNGGGGLSGAVLRHGGTVFRWPAGSIGLVKNWTAAESTGVALRGSAAGT